MTKEKHTHKYCYEGRSENYGPKRLKMKMAERERERENVREKERTLLFCHK